ncbi:hypothetical protein CNMCM8694_003511 [Aspergillus lentulus]|nr:hypothetical protein CNMCM8060_009681 [Aspergillus lentulus]KAF4190621.1 hypothetical protein CNMCM8694_003511 [Aspergillus lentulus]
MTKRNQARLARPSRNNYSMKPGTKLGKRDDVAAPPPLFNITDQIARAAALVAELEAGGSAGGNYTKLYRRVGTFWMEGIARKGAIPSFDMSSTTMGLIPQVKESIIGDANNWQTIPAASSFVGLGVLSTDVYIRNLKIDITASNPGAYVAALHYQVAQATTIENVEIIADSATPQQGMYAENGSGGVMSDITFACGNFGIYRGTQQFSAARLTFNGCNTAVEVIWDWGWVWKSITVKNAKVGFRLYNDANGQIPGSVTIIDSVFSGTESFAIEMAVPVDVVDSGFTGLALDNVRLDRPIKDHWSDNLILSSGYYKSYVMGAGLEIPNVDCVGSTTSTNPDVYLWLHSLPGTITGQKQIIFSWHDALLARNLATSAAHVASYRR